MLQDIRTGTLFLGSGIFEQRLSERGVGDRTHQKHEVYQSHPILNHINQFIV
jgi:hypothetical protein